MVAQDLARLGDRAAGGDHVVDHENVSALDVADDVHRLYFAAALAPFVDDADFAAQNVGVDLRPFHIADVRRDEDAIGHLEALEPLDQHRRSGQVIDRHVEESLHLCRVQVDGDDAIGAGALE